MERLIKYFVPERYELRLQFYLDEMKFSGIADINGEVKDETVKFHAVNLKIKSVEVDDKPIRFKLENGTLVLFDMKLGKVDIRICYDGAINENMEGVYLSTYEYEGKTERIITTQFESHYAREAFPCIDEPAAKAVFELSSTVPDKDDLVLSNMPVKNVVKNTTVFEPTPRMSTYLLAWVIGKFHGKTVKNAHGVEITSYCTLAQELDAVDFAN